MPLACCPSSSSRPFSSRSGHRMVCCLVCIVHALGWVGPAMAQEGDAEPQPSWADRTGPEAFGIDLARVPVTVRLEDELHQVLRRYALGEGGFPGVLDRWHHGFFEKAAGELMGLESFVRLSEPLGNPVPANAITGTIDDGDLRTARLLPGEKCLQRLHGAMIEGTTTLDPEALLPLAWLYFDDYLDNAADRPWLARFSLPLARDLLGRLPAELDEGEALVAAFHLRWAEPYFKTEHFDHGLRAIEHLDRALEQVPGHPVALYWSGFMLEKYGYYGRALRAYQRLAKEMGAEVDAEVRLRIALNQVREGQRRQGLDGLRELADLDAGLDSAVPPWVRRIAVGEWVREYDDDPEAAVALLRRALDRVGDDANLRLQLAYHLRTSDWGETVGHLRRVELAGARGGMTPRGLYDLAREDGLKDSRAWLVGEVIAHRPALVAALDALADTRGQDPEARGVFASCEELADVLTPPSAD